MVPTVYILFFSILYNKILFLDVARGFIYFPPRIIYLFFHNYGLPLFSIHSFFFSPSLIIVNLSSSIYMSTWTLTVNGMISPHLSKLHWTLKVHFKSQVLHLAVWGTDQCWSLPHYHSIDHNTWVSSRCVILSQLEAYDLPLAVSTDLGTKQTFNKHLNTNGYRKIRNVDTLKKLSCICIFIQQCLWSP